MPPLHDRLAVIAARPDAAGALVMSDEGLVVDAVLPGGLEAEALAALAATALRAHGALGDALHHGAPTQIVIDAPHGSCVIDRLGKGLTMLVLASGQGDLGQLLHDLRLDAPAIAEMI